MSMKVEIMISKQIKKTFFIDFKQRGQKGKAIASNCCKEIKYEFKQMVVRFLETALFIVVWLCLSGHSGHCLLEIILSLIVH